LLAWLVAIGLPSCGGGSDHAGGSDGTGALDAGGGSATADAITDTGSGNATGDDGAAPPESGADSASAGSGHDGGADAAHLDASTGDAGAQPFKGVANSACSDLARLGVTWFYNWTTGAGGCTKAPFVPMIWGHTGNEQSATGIAGEVKSIAGAGFDTVLGFNEPDNSSQSNMSVATAISLWPSLAANASLRVGSPATQANSTGQAWFTSFMSQVNADTTGTLRVDFIAAHWYGWNAGSCDAKAANLESYLRWLEGIAGNRPIWLTEWGCLNQSNPTEATVQAFFSGAVAMFAKHPRLERYAWYPWTTNNELVNADGGALTPLGTTFAAAPATR
jgi:hypothetical protein